MTQTPTKQTEDTQRHTSDVRIRNEVVFMGNLGKDPEMNYTSGGKAVTKFSLAVWQGKDKETLWLNVTCWEKLAEEMNQAVQKGARVQVHGRLTLDIWKDKYYYGVTANSVVVLKKGKTSSADEQVDPLGDEDDHPF